MHPLEKNLRNKLESTVKEARDVAEMAAKAALDQLGVGESAPFAHLSDQDRELRRKLRAHGRQLGDSLNGAKEQTMDRLIEETAYEHWHRMLFARFLAENDLLIYDGVPVTLEECEELAPEEDAANGWELAARLAAGMLPQIFRPDSPVFQLNFAANYQLPLEKLLADLPADVFTASDSIGWVYQFWQAKRKDKVNASGVKIGARELPAVTQLFTEPYMVSFLLDNSLGAWWAARRLSDADFKNAGSEEELRRKASIPGVHLDYLRFVRQEGGTWTPAAGTFDGWPEQLADLKTLDPCCGSGHFLVAAFLMLVPMRMEREGLSAKEAVDAVLRENIHGLELDQRCVELAAFALALTAWKYQGAGGYRVLPELNVACSGLSVGAAREEWRQLGLNKKNLGLALAWMHDFFSQAPVLGSLLDPTASDGAKLIEWEELSQTLDEALSREQGEEVLEVGVAAQGLARAARMLADRYHWIITNVPYLGRGNQNEVLMNYCERYYAEGKRDLAYSFYQRLVQLQDTNGVIGIVWPQGWLFQPYLKKFRGWLTKNNSISVVCGLGAGAFETISGEVVNVSLLISKKKKEDSYYAMDINELKSIPEKCYALKQNVLLKIYLDTKFDPELRIPLNNLSSFQETLGKHTRSIEGLSTGDKDRFIKNHWEFHNIDKAIWSYYQNSPPVTSHFKGLSEVLKWENGEGILANYSSARIQGHEAWGKQGILSCKMGQIRSTIYLGGLYDKTCVALTPASEDVLNSLFVLSQSDSYNEIIRGLDARLCVATSVFESIPLNNTHNIHGLPKPYSDDPTQWIFHGHPCGSVVWDEEQMWSVHGQMRNNDTVVHVAVARLLGYRWPSELDISMELADEQREWVNRCEALTGYADDDGIVCIPPVRGEASAADRLLNLLAAAYGDAWSNDTLAALLKSADHAGKPLETWLREKFFRQHCKLFQHRPFIWHIWDGLRDGFAALVNYHKLDHKLLETLIYTYLGDWISRQKQDKDNGVDGAQEKLAAAESLKKKLELILEGKAPYDIFVRWKPLAQQAIGWHPDLNDGVRLNIRPFMTVPDVAKKGAGVLRDKANIKWTKDRGKDVPSAPWYHLFNGERINDHHLSLEEKLTARKGKGGQTC